MKSKMLVLTAVLLFAGSALAQELGPVPPAPLAPQRPLAPPAPLADPFGGALFPPELVMTHQRAIGLDTEQRDAIRETIRSIQPQFTDLQWEMQDAAEVMRSLLDKTQVDEEKVLGQLEQVLDIERRVKRLQFQLMVRTKNVLTKDQQAQLRVIRGGLR